MRLIFKKSFLVKIGNVVLIVGFYASIGGFACSSFGLHVLTYITPLGLVIIYLGVKFLKKDILVLQSLSKQLTMLSDLDLNQDINEKFAERNDEFGEISRSVKILVQKLQFIMQDIRKTSEELFEASHQLNSSAREIAEGANEQAAEAEEVSASMEEVSSAIHTSTDKASQTGEISLKVSAEMNDSNEILTQLIESIKIIDDKTSQIEEIAGRTNLLALNAAVEAARAGDAGRGFSVVASEIRGLAERAHIVSAEISEISRTGREVSQLATEKLQILVPEVNKSAEFVSEIVISNEENLMGINQANTSIQELSRISSLNSDSAQRMTVSSQNLSEQAEKLKKIVRQFSI